MTTQCKGSTPADPIDPIDPIDSVKYMELCYVIVDDIYIPQGYNRRQLSEYESACPYIYCLPLAKEQWTSFRPGANMLYTYTKMPDASVEILHDIMTIGQWYCVYNKYEMMKMRGTTLLSTDKLDSMRSRGYVN